MTNHHQDGWLGLFWQTNQLSLIFHSDHSVSLAGFRAEWRVVEQVA